MLGGKYLGSWVFKSPFLPESHLIQENLELGCYYADQHRNDPICWHFVVQLAASSLQWKLESLIINVSQAAPAYPSVNIKMVFACAPLTHLRVLLHLLSLFDVALHCSILSMVTPTRGCIYMYSVSVLPATWNLSHTEYSPEIVAHSSSSYSAPPHTN